MGSLRHISLPGAIILLATLVFRLSGPEAEWLLDSLSHLRRRLATPPFAGAGISARADPGPPSIPMDSETNDGRIPVRQPPPICLSSSSPSLNFLSETRHGQGP